MPPYSILFLLISAHFLKLRVVDWARLITVEERSYIRDKIKAAYERKASTYEDLLELTCAIEEEFVFAAAPSRLDYFKSGNNSLKIDLTFRIFCITVLEHTANTFCIAL